jgi:hypothetical protein
LDVGELAWVHVKLANNKSVTIWPGHAPLLAETIAETIRYEDQNGAQRVEFPAGILDVNDDVVTLFLDRVAGDPMWNGEKSSTKGAFDRLAEYLLADLPVTR